VSSLCVPQLEVRVRKRIAGSICVLSASCWRLHGWTKIISAPQPKFRQSIKKSAIGSLPSRATRSSAPIGGRYFRPATEPPSKPRSTSPTKT